MKCPHHYMMEMQEVGCEQCKKAPIIPKIAIKRRRENSMKNAYYTQFVGPFSKEGDREQQPPESELRQICHKKPKEHQFNNFRKFKSGKRQGTIGTRIGSLHALTETNLRDQVKSISTNIEADSHSIRCIGSSQYAVSTGLNSTILYKSRQTTVPFPSRLDNHYCEEEKGNYEPKFMKAYGASHINNTIPRKEKDLRNFIILDMPEDIKVPLILGRPFLSTARAKIDVYKRKITLRVGEEKIIFKSVKPYMLSLRERMELDLEARLMEETLVLNRSLDPFLEYYIELNDLNEPFELRRNQGDDLMPTIKEGEVIEELRTRDEDLDIGIDDCPSYCDDDKKIYIDYAHNLKFSCMIGFEFTHINFYLLLYVNVMSRKFHNSIMQNKMVYKRDNVVGALMNVPIFVGTLFVMMIYAVLEDIDVIGMMDLMGDVMFERTNS
ncbi:reverse transcriptase domain-containing protein [Tanacetum coccineum]